MSIGDKRDLTIINETQIDGLHKKYKLNMISV